MQYNTLVNKNNYLLVFAFLTTRDIQLALPQPFFFKCLCIQQGFSNCIGQCPPSHIFREPHTLAQECGEQAVRHAPFALFSKCCKTSKSHGGHSLGACRLLEPELARRGATVHVGGQHRGRLFLSPFSCFFCGTILRSPGQEKSFCKACLHHSSHFRSLFHGPP